MSFWIVMLCFISFIPLMMILFGKIFLKHFPKKINYLFGYRTNRSMKNEATWEFAHKTLGKIWWILGIVSLIFSLIVMVFLGGQDKDTIGNAGSIIMIVQILTLLVSIFYVENKLKKHFDDEGNPLT